MIQKLFAITFYLGSLPVRIFGSLIGEEFREVPDCGILGFARCEKLQGIATSLRMILDFKPEGKKAYSGQTTSAWRRTLTFEQKSIRIRP